MDATNREQVFKLKDRCMEKALAGRGDTSLDSATFNKAKVFLNFSIGPNMTYNELANKLDSMIREFR